ncbi:MAG TPA: hypothetical protein VFS43_45195 [Polyangiaceae bacterium]|nr:hypothetical protein [Polyangiaceae bacterium]
MEAGRPVRREFEYVRHGTVRRMGADDVRRGERFGFVAGARGTEAFVARLDHVDACYPESKGHLVCDNQAEHVWGHHAPPSARLPPGLHSHATPHRDLVGFPNLPRRPRHKGPA